MDRSSALSAPMIASDLEQYSENPRTRDPDPKDRSAQYQRRAGDIPEATGRRSGLVEEQ